jgi:hypothetical protein
MLLEKDRECEPIRLGQPWEIIAGRMPPAYIYVGLKLIVRPILHFPIWSLSQ